jgi:glutamate-5-semialdehyde dehydrogenase
VRYSADVVPATDEDLTAEYPLPNISAAVVPSLDAAVEHIRRYGTGYSEGIVTSSVAAAGSFTARVDAAPCW